MPDARLRSSKLDYTILAPGTLIDEKGTGQIQASEKLGFHGYLPREDLAAVIVETLRNYIQLVKPLNLFLAVKK